ncbi:hypothetical protein [Paenibacillus sp. HGH0039]|nr:hypothetical protein [Paenibacillus sp. HGH0039]EGL18554.1 hypothetical protein HMPREF9413_5908 [Paenibacillus sp. HGF7]EPD80535.1 hypothetical protein HMPREF1207_05641 [Paenibacillus sp. HGH0039]
MSIKLFNKKLAELRKMKAEANQLSQAYYADAQMKAFIKQFATQIPSKNADVLWSPELMWKFNFDYDSLESQFDFLTKELAPKTKQQYCDGLYPELLEDIEKYIPFQKSLPAGHTPEQTMEATRRTIILIDQQIKQKNDFRFYNGMEIKITKMNLLFLDKKIPAGSYIELANIYMSEIDKRIDSLPKQEPVSAATPRRGGKRNGAGRKSLGVKKPITITLPEADWIEIDNLIQLGVYSGYADYFRSLHNATTTK